jgi:hypothetical protein
MEYKESSAFLNSNVSQYGSHMIMTNVQKPTKTKIINMDTRFLDEYQVNTNVYPITLSDKITNVKSMKIVSAEIPISYYNVSASLGNNIFMVTDIVNNRSYIIKVPNGFYTSANIGDLKTSVNAQFSSYSINTSISFDISFNGYANFTVSSNKNFQIDFAINTNGEFDKYNFKNKLGWLFGFRNTTYKINTVGSGSSSTLVSEVFTNFNVQR